MGKVIRQKITWLELVREYFPKATDEEANGILWECTGFPCFWNIPQNGLTAEQCCRNQLKDLQSKLTFGKRSER